MEKIKTIVIDDEKTNRDLVTGLIHQLNTRFEVIGEADGVEAGIELINRLHPQVVFLDIRMQDGTGFNLLNKLRGVRFEVVFVSGFDNYAIQAFEFNALDYVLKPIDPVKFSRTLLKVENRILNSHLLDSNLRAIVESYDSERLIISKIPIHAGNKVFLVNIQDIISMLADEGCTEIKTTSYNSLVSSKQLSDFEFILENYPTIIRINRSCFINVNHIKSYTKGFTCEITLVNGDCHEVSRRKKADVLELLRKNRN